MRKRVVLALAILAFAVPMCVSSVQPEAAEMEEQTELKITAYDGFGLVSGKWKGLLPAGYASVSIENVPERMDVSTVVFSSEGVELIEQDYSYDLVSRDKLYENYLGEEIVAREEGEGGRLVAGTLLSYQGDSLVIEGSDGKVHLVKATSVELPALPEGLTTKPTLTWLVRSLGGTKEAELSYLTNGISWETDYNAFLNQEESEMEISSTVSVTNDAGADFEEADLTLVAGEVNRVEEQVYRGMVAMAETAKDVGGGFSQSQLSEYHAYSLERKVTLEDGSTKQIPFLSDDVEVEKEYVFDSNEPVYIRETGAQGVAVEVKFESGVEMPAGTVRVYKRQDNSLRLLGEDTISHTPEGEEVRLKTGESFDIVVEKTETERRSLGSCSYEASYEVEVRNHKEEDVTVTVIERVWGDVDVVESSLTVYEDEARKKSWRVPIEAEGSSTLTYTLRRIC